MCAAFRRKLGRPLLVLAVIAAAAVSIGGAQADSWGETLVDHDPVSTLGGGDFEFRDGNLDWYYGQYDINAHLTGEMRVDNADGSCVRMRMEYFDDGDSLNVKQGNSMCAEDGKTHLYEVDLNPWGDYRVDLIKVSLQKKTGANGWTIVESAYFKPTLESDDVRIHADGVDFGGDSFAFGEPVGSGSMDWTQGEDMDITPHLRGYLHLDDMAGLCARVDLVYFDRWWGSLDEEHGASHCAPDNSHVYWSIDLKPYTSSQITDVTVKLQTLSANGSWQTVDAEDTAYVDAN
jgi:hypothetical protein